LVVAVLNIYGPGKRKFANNENNVRRVLPKLSFYEVRCTKKFGFEITEIIVVQNATKDLTPIKYL
jgi:hypothetical protein